MTTEISAAHEQLLSTEQHRMADRIVTFLSESSNTGIKKSDLQDIHVYLTSLSLTDGTTPDCYLEVLTETELSDNDSEVSELSLSSVSDVESEVYSDDESVGAIRI